MRKLLAILIGVSLLLLVGCDNRVNKTAEPVNGESSIAEKMHIPTLSVTDHLNCILAERGGYIWNTGSESITVDAASPEQIADKMAGDKVSPEAQITLSFSETPHKVSVVDWSKTKSSSFAFDRDKIVAPKEEGTYIYEVIGEWEQGQVSFTLKLVVSKERT